MANKIYEPVLTDHEMMKFQRRLSSYLRDYGYKNDIQDKEIATKVDISPQKFSYLKSEKKPYPKFINSLDHLARLARLEQMTLSEFVEYLEGKRDKKEEDGKKFYDWQKSLLEAFEPLTIKIRSAFIDLCKQSAREGKRKLELLLDIVNILKDKDVNAIESFRDALKKIT